MKGRAFSGQLLVAALAVSASLLAEAAVTAAAAWSAGAETALAATLWTLGAWAWPGALFSGGLAVLLAATCGERSPSALLREVWREPERRERAAATLLAVSLFGALVFGLALGASGFKNVELASALIALGALLAALVAFAVSLGMRRAARKLRERGRAGWAFVPGALLALVLASWILRASWPGLRQLDGRLWLAPLAGSLVLAAPFALRLQRQLGARVVLALGLVFALAWGAFLFAGERGTRELLRYGAWSRPLIALGRTLSDVDRDGYSSLLAGGDCAPFDARIHPAAAELPGDGIDNNCIGGDGGKLTAARRPVWGAAAHGSLKNLNIVIVTIETLRADHASFVAAARDTTPNLRQLAKEALVFERMYSSAPMTRLAIASLFSSFAPSEIDWLPQAREKRMRRLGPATPWLPELLAARGYETIAVLSDFSAFTAAEAAGFERGFRHYDISTKLEYRGGTMWGFPAAEQVDKALGYARAAERPYLLWLHLFEPHYSYEQPPGAPIFGGDEQARYDAEIWHVDRELGRLFAELRRMGGWDETVVFVSGDHGEAFGEHDDRFHGSNLHDPQLRTAALLKVPGLPGRRVSEAVTFTDLAPTLARIIGDRSLFERLRGRSLAPLFHRGKLPAASSSFVAEAFSVDDGHGYQAALIDHPLKLIYAEEGRAWSLFDLTSDPGERAPLDPEVDPRGHALRQELVAYLERSRPRALQPPR